MENVDIVPVNIKDLREIYEETACTFLIIYILNMPAL
jgi:hypothetical protein